MSIAKTFIKSHPLLTYYTLVFVFSWGGILVVIGPSGILGTKEISKVMLPIVYLAPLVGPGVAGILSTALIDGRAGLGELLSRLRRWRVGARWYAVALLTAPILMTAILFALSLSSPGFLPAIVTSNDRAGLLLSGTVMGLAVGFFEELGWTGFAVPRWRVRNGVLATGLFMGFIWGAWHFPLFSGSARSSEGVAPILFLAVLLFSWLPAYRVLMVWVYERTASPLVVMLMHAPLAAIQLILLPPAISAVGLVTFDLVFAAALWIVVAAVVVVNRGQLSGQAVRTE